MTVDLGTLIASIEEEFDVALDADQVGVLSIRDLVEYVAEAMDADAEPVDPDERVEHVEAVMGELLAQLLGVTRWDDDATFAALARSARRR